MRETSQGRSRRIIARWPGRPSRSCSRARDVEQEIEARRAALETLLSNVSGRIDDFDNVMSTFTVAVDESLARAERRANDIGTALAGSAQAAVERIGGQMEALSQTASQEHGKAAEAFEALSKQSAAEMARYFGSAVGNLRSSATEIRTVAGEVHRELDAARQDLHRSAVELPKETAEQAAQLRRVVEDQVRALQELTTFIGRVSTGNDVVLPAGMPARVLPESTAPPLHPACARSAARLAHAPHLPCWAGGIEEPGAGAPAGDHSHDGSRSRLALRSARPGQPRRGRCPSRRGEAGDRARRAGAVRAARRLLPLRPPKRAGTLATLSFDIGRLIDEAAASSAWEKFRRGEPGAFTRSIYTDAGAQTFDELCRRYRDDGEFSQTVNRYTQEFERLLTEVGRDDREGSVTNTYLNSETGKVYTLLAHAAGRLG